MRAGSITRRCRCRDENGRDLGATCPKLGRRGHGAWHCRQELPAAPDGTRRRFRRDGFRTSDDAQAVLDHAEPGARLVFSCGWHISRDGRDRYSRRFRAGLRIATWLAKLLRVVEIDDQVEACRRIFASDRRWTVVRGSDLEEGESQGLPVWSEHIGDPVLASNLTRRVDFALFMVEALTDDTLVGQVPAIVGRATPSALAHAGGSTTGPAGTGVS